MDVMADATNVTHDRSEPAQLTHAQLAHAQLAQRVLQTDFTITDLHHLLYNKDVNGLIGQRDILLKAMLERTRQGREVLDVFSLHQNILLRKIYGAHVFHTSSLLVALTEVHTKREKLKILLPVLYAVNAEMTDVSDAVHQFRYVFS